jgi:demethylmenaquinone methyltransferase/2-methoxy-6-polyprenyl-1,4-benzoquinol methylase
VSVESGRLAPEAVRSMFDRISPVYDAMNRTMTMGLDQRWRRATVAAVVQPGDRVLDACCGTGDLAVAARRAGATVTGLDFSEQMLERARPAASACARCSSSSPRVRARRRSPRVPRSSSCTWRRSSTTT